ncbi:hypothetical protein ILUMI_25134 [Ignelater luminosus]|uniref:Uncharacterized protein n=1 Tax=Ignelater luminosus TaxID=2038154 RepID=A0A8K0C8Z7_IGNLU|nr:hypothetical protein ILUMI_25134 [Ignelater luminosus]
MKEVETRLVITQKHQIPGRGFDSDGRYSDTYYNEDIPNVSSYNWNVLSDLFANKQPRPLQGFSADYVFHPAIDFQECKDRVNSFECFMSPSIVTKLCERTKKRAKMYFLQKNTIIVWTSIEKTREKRIVGFYSPEFSNWTSRVSSYFFVFLKWDIVCAGPKVFDKSIMSRNRYLSIFNFVRFSPPKSARPGAPMARLGILMAMLRGNCMTLVHPGPVFAIDKHLMLYKGKLHFRQHIKSKRSRFGIKIFDLCPETHLEKIAVATRRDNVFSAGCFSKKAEVWYNYFTDKRGEAVLEFLKKEQLNCINKPDKPTTFKSPNEEGNIDFVMVQDDIERK